VAQVVDVLRGAGEVDELRHRRQLRVVADPLLQEILDRLDVVVGGALDGLDRLGIVVRERGFQLFQEGGIFRRQPGQRFELRAIG
jgi:hypothetical protein